MITLQPFILRQRLLYGLKVWPQSAFLCTFEPLFLNDVQQTLS